MPLVSGTGSSTGLAIVTGVTLIKGSATGTSIVTGIPKRLIPAVGSALGAAAVTGGSALFGSALGAATVTGASKPFITFKYLLASGNAGDDTQNHLTGANTYFWPLGGVAWVNTQEVDVQRAAGLAGTYVNYGVRIITNTFTIGQTATYNFRKNGSNGNQAISIAGVGIGYFTDSVHSDSVAVADLVNLSININNGSPTATGTQSFIQFSGGTDLVYTNTNVSTGRTGTNYYYIAGAGRAGVEPGRLTEDGTIQVTVRAPATLSQLQITINSNANPAAETFRFRKNGGNGNQSVSIPGSTTGIFRDAAHTDSIVSGDLINYSLTLSGFSHRFTAMSVSAVPTGIAQDIILSASGPITAGTSYSIFGGVMSTLVLPESVAQGVLPSPATLSHFRAHVTPTGGTACTLSVRKNSANGNSSISVISSSSGVFEDAVNTDTFNTGDTIDYGNVSSGAQFNFDWFASTLGASFPVSGTGSAIGFATVTGIVKLIRKAIGSATGLAIVTGRGQILTPPIGPITAMFIVNGVVYGMIGSGQYPGFDVPFAYRISTNSLLPLSGVYPTTIPFSPATSGDWQPPTMEMIGTTIVVTHPGFTGANGNFFGWFDVSVDFSPKWHAGNTTGTGLIKPPRAVGQFNDRFYFAVDNAAVVTDAGDLNISNPAFVLILGDKTPINCFVGQPVSTTSTGILQAIIALKANSIFQITGDPALANWVENEMSTSLGTDAPRSVVQTPAGIKFKAVDGIRTIDVYGGISDPDPDLAVPFIHALYPSRISAGYNSNVYRISIQNGALSGAPHQEYWLDLKRDGWTGPHTFTQDIAVPYKGTFIVATNNNPTVIFKSDVMQTGSDQFIEVGASMSFDYKTTDMTQVGNMYANCTVKSTLEIALPADGSSYDISGLNEDGVVLATAFFDTVFDGHLWHDTPGPIHWGDGSLWGVSTSALRPRIISWTQPLVFNRLVEEITGPCSQEFKVGAFFTAYERLNYMMP